MNPPDFIAYIEDMIEAIDKILRYIDTVQNVTEFLQNDMMVDAVTRNFEIIGEAAHNVPKHIKEAYPSIPWKQMYGLRNFAVHEYHIIDPQLLWDIAQDHLTDNKIQLEQILIEHPEN